MKVKKPRVILFIFDNNEELNFYCDKIKDRHFIRQEGTTETGRRIDLPAKKMTEIYFVTTDDLNKMSIDEFRYFSENCIGYSFTKSAAISRMEEIFDNSLKGKFETLKRIIKSWRK